MSLTDRQRLILITGASEGIGRATTSLFVRRGDRVVALARNRERLASLVEECGGEQHVSPVVADVTDGPGMTAAAESVLKTHGAPDVVIANAGIGLDAPFVDTSDELLGRVLEVNVLGVVRTVRPFVRPLAERGSGRILLISSVVGKRGIPNYSAYSASKFALHGMAESLRTELLDSGVSVGLVCPSSTESQFAERRLTEGTAQKNTRLVRHSAESVARAIYAMAGSRRRELVLSWEGKAMAVANRWIPGLLDRILARVLIRR